MAAAARAKIGNTPMAAVTSPARQFVRPPTESAILVDQTDAPGTNSYTSQDFEASFDIYDNQGADDFTVPGGDTWTVNQIVALGVYYNGFGPMPTANVYFYNDNAGFPGSLITTVNAAPASDVGGTITVNLPNIVLGSGTYWVSVQARMDFGAGGQWGWTGNSTPAGDGAAWQNPGDGFVTGCTTWGREATCIAATESEKAYILSGEVSGGGMSCGDIFFFNAKCNMNGAAQAMVKATGDWSSTTVTFDLDGEDYVSTVNSNGTNSIAKMTVPHAGMGSHTVTLEVPGGCYSPVTFNCQVDATPDPEWDAMWAEALDLEAATALKAVPTETRIIGNYPNPFNPSTTIRYALSVDSPVSVRVYNMLGQEVATLVNGFQKAGEQSVEWHGTNNFGQAVASGLYIYRLQAGNSVMTQKMLFTK
jgi:uncharacterized protein YciU (UPF0263 family)